MRIDVEERGLVIEAIATLAYRKFDMWNFVLKPAGVPKTVYERLSLQRDDLTGRRLTKRQMAPLILEVLEGVADYSLIVGKMVEIAANWEKFELADQEYEARAVKAKAQEILAKHQMSEHKRLIYKKVEEEKQEREYRSERRRELGLLLAMFDESTDHEQDHQARGYLLQDLLNRVFLVFDIPVHRSFTRNEGAEQIDGAFQIDGWFYLTECRWRQNPSDTRELDGFLGQIQRSGKQTMGLFISVNGWSKNVPRMLKQNTEKAIVLMQGYDLRTILSEEVDLRNYILASVKNLNLKAEPYLSVREYLRQST